MKKINEILKSRPFFAVIACIASVLLWMYVANYENTTQTVNLTGLKINYIGGEDVLHDRNLVVTDRDVQDVNLTLMVKRSLVSALTNETVHVSVDLRDIRNTGVYDRVYTISYDGVEDSDVLVTRKFPEYVTVNIDQMVTKPVEVRGVFDGTVAEGYMREPVVYDPEVVLISGPETLVAQVECAQVVIDRENLNKTVTGSVGFTLRDEEGLEVESTELSSDVAEIGYTIPVVMVKDVVLKVNLLAGGGASEGDAIVKVDPPVVTLSGDAETLNGINQIVLGTIDLSDFAQSDSETFAIPLPNGVASLSGEKEAKVDVSIKGLATKKLITTNFSFVNVSEGYVAKAITQYKEVLIRGPKEIVDLIEGSNVTIVGDLTDIGNAVGRYSVPTSVVISGYSEAGVVGDDYNVVVSLELYVPEEETEGAEGPEKGGGGA